MKVKLWGEAPSQAHVYPSPNHVFSPHACHQAPIELWQATKCDNFLWTRRICLRHRCGLFWRHPRGVFILDRCCFICGRKCFLKQLPFLSGERYSFCMVAYVTPAPASGVPFYPPRLQRGMRVPSQESMRHLRVVISWWLPSICITLRTHEWLRVLTEACSLESVELCLFCWEFHPYKYPTFSPERQHCGSVQVFVVVRRQPPHLSATLNPRYMPSPHWRTTGREWQGLCVPLLFSVSFCRCILRKVAVAICKCPFSGIIWVKGKNFCRVSSIGLYLR